MLGFKRQPCSSPDGKHAPFSSRTNHRPYNETPTKGPVMNSKFAKILVKGAISIGISAVIGYTIRLEKEIEKRIDGYYDEEVK